ncbi:hypothetical protein [Cellulomonas bogoriensis]
MTWTDLAAPTLALVGALLGSLAGPWVKGWIDERSDKRRAVDRAVAALTTAQAYRHLVLGGVAAVAGGGPRGEALAQTIREDRVREFVDAMYDCHRALAEVRPWLDEAMRANDDWEITEEEAACLIKKLRQLR